MMNAVFCITIRYLQPYAHARSDSDNPEWPPSPLRMLQALAAASAGRWNERSRIAVAAPAIQWLESQPPPEMVAAPGIPSKTPYRLYVPDNTGDHVARSWIRGGNDIFSRTDKDTCPTHLAADAVHYLYPIGDADSKARPHIETLSLAVHSITHLGWGIDVVIGNAQIITPHEANALVGDRWVTSQNGMPLRVPRAGTLEDLTRRHAESLNRFGQDGTRPAPLRVYGVARYRRTADPLPRPYRVFKLLDENGGTYRHPHAKLIKIAGMVRHLAIEVMKRNPPNVDDPAVWVERFVAGHQNPVDKTNDLPHRQLSYVPLPSTGHPHTDPGIRRVLIVGPPGESGHLEYLARQLNGLQLKPERQGDLRGPVFLESAQRDNVARLYTEPAVSWASFTPVILPGHDDHKPEKTRKLIEKALLQAGVDQLCEFEWSAFSRFAKSYSAHKYDRSKRLTGYIRPDHLREQTAVHLALRFHDGSKDMRAVSIPGPLTIGAGRHCGFGLFAAASENP